MLQRNKLVAALAITFVLAESVMVGWAANHNRGNRFVSLDTYDHHAAQTRPESLEPKQVAHEAAQSAPSSKAVVTASPGDGTPPLAPSRETATRQ